jgi:signal transduction histidine kinase
MSGSLRALLVDDSRDDAELVMRELRRAGGELVARVVDDAPSLQRALEAEAWDVVICDWSMPRFSGLAAHELVKRIRGDVPFIIASGTCTEEMAIRAMQSGARDWVSKNSLGRLAPAVTREVGKERERRRHEEALRQSEERLRQAQKMEAIGGLAAGVAHDFNNLLSVILGHASLVLGDVAPDDRNRESLVDIRDAAERAAELTRRLLTFGRQQVMQPRVVALEHVVGGLEKMLRRLIGEDVELSVVALGSDEVLVDPSQLEQVIINLVVNARDAMPGGGRLTIETRHVELDGDGAAAYPGLKAGPHALLSVTDTGIGMDAATRARIFEPFFTTKAPGHGTGLGLAMVFGIVSQSGGAIATRSEPGRGTTIEILLPAAPANDTARARPSLDPEDDAPGGTETILLVEDEEAVRELVHKVLARGGYEVLVAANGDEALAVADGFTRPIDLLLTDVVMPRMSGPVLATCLAERRPGLKKLFMSGYAGGAFSGRTEDAPSPFLAKPVTARALLRAVRSVLGPIVERAVRSTG